MRKQALHPRTEIINKKQKNGAKMARDAALSWLASTFPEAFDNRVRIQPLKLGIMDEILQHADKAAEAGISKSKLREAVVMFTRRIDYLTCLKAREMRIDLDGHPVEQVAEEDALRAAEKIKKRVEKNARNARKMMATPTPSAASQKTSTPVYPEYAPSFSVQNNTPSSLKSAAVIVKHKTARAYDPKAVARLKEKLGLSIAREQSEEKVD
jgi:ProP effector